VGNGDSPTASFSRFIIFRNYCSAPCWAGGFLAIGVQDGIGCALGPAPVNPSCNRRADASDDEHSIPPRFSARRRRRCPARGCQCHIMPFRQSVALFSSHIVQSSLPLLCYSPQAPGCTTSLAWRPRSHTNTHTHSTPLQARTYAQHASSPQYPDDDLSWPDPVHPHQTPTPYQILHCKRGDAYSKSRFYALVKLYHPDRSDPSSPLAHLPHTTRLERYRLLVAAHTILADEEKRKAYDAWGHGWKGHHQTPSQTSAHHWGAPHQRQWSEGHDPINNATWEDWERWYHRENGTEAAPRDQFMTNIAFVALVFSIVSLGGILQGTRANRLTTSAMERADKVHKEASLELRRSKHATMSGDRNERIRTFLEHREAVNAGEYAYQRLLPPAETCAPDTAVRKE
jgi:curved DNA-binding protein CbpA